MLSSRSKVFGNTKWQSRSRKIAALQNDRIRKHEKSLNGRAA